MTRAASVETVLEEIDLLRQQYETERDLDRRRCEASLRYFVRRAYWLPKLERNAKRDRRARAALRRAGWRVLTVWECQLARPESAARRISAFLAKRESSI